MDTVKKYLISSGRVFVSVVITSLVATGGNISWTATFWTPIIIAGISAVLKAFIDPQVTPALGGTKRV